MPLYAVKILCKKKTLSSTVYAKFFTSKKKKTSRFFFSFDTFTRNTKYCKKKKQKKNENKKNTRKVLRFFFFFLNCANNCSKSQLLETYFSLSLKNSWTLFLEALRKCHFWKLYEYKSQKIIIVIIVIIIIIIILTKNLWGKIKNSSSHFILQLKFHMNIESFKRCFQSCFFVSPRLFSVTYW